MRRIGLTGFDRADLRTLGRFKGADTLGTFRLIDDENILSFADSLIGTNRLASRAADTICVNEIRHGYTSSFIPVRVLYRRCDREVISFFRFISQNCDIYLIK
jgi:hypothetical protein